MEISADRTLVSPHTVAQKVAAVIAGAAAIALSAQVRVYLGFTDVPVTLQVLGILLVAFALGDRLATCSAVAYIAAGAAGAPVFGGWQGGMAYLTSTPTLGYILAFPIAANLVGGLWQDRKTSTFGYAWLAAILGVVYIYLGGFAWQAAQMIPVAGLQTGLTIAFFKTIGPFILIDAAKAAVAAGLAVGVYKGRLPASTPSGFR